MRLPPRLQITADARRHLVDVATARRPADLVLRGGGIVNVYSAAIEPGSIGIAGGRVAWVGEEEGREAREYLDLDGALVVPGLIEPHCHPDILYTPSAAVPAYVAYGTTTVCADVLFFLRSLDDETLIEVLEGMARASVKFLWHLRAGVDGLLPWEATRLGAGRLIRLAESIPGVVASGEMTTWPRLLAGDERLCAFTEAVVGAGLRVDGHAAGTSPRTLGSVAAAGITADHEAISPAEVEARLRLGYWVMLRHSSLRPDGPGLAAGLAASGLPTDRVMLTTDGPVPGDLAAGNLDAVIRQVVEAGIDPITAVRLATLHPATYLGLDAHLGGIAPGRCADLVVVESLSSFHPRLTVVDGRPLAPGEARCGAVDWETLGDHALTRAPLDGTLLARVCRDGPAMALEGVITRAAPRPVGDPLPPGTCYAALVSQQGDWVTGSTLRGLAVEALASSFTGSGDVLLLGRDPQATVAAYDRLIEAGGGIVTPGAEVPLPILGRLSDRPLEVLARDLAAVEDRLEGRPPVPLPYLLLFLSLGVLPDLRLSPLGVVDVKTASVVSPRVPLVMPAEPAVR